MCFAQSAALLLRGCGATLLRCCGGTLLLRCCAAMSFRCWALLLAATLLRTPAALLGHEVSGVSTESAPGDPKRKKLYRVGGEWE